MSYIIDVLGNEEVLAQLAEECQELGQVALKMRRALSGINPTPKTVEQCAAHMDEEIADVMLCLMLLGYLDDPHVFTQQRIVNEKLLRWERRLKQK